MLKDLKFWKDCIIGTVFIFAFLFFASKFLAIFSFLDPVGEALEDMKITDQIFSNDNFRETPEFSEEITIVNFGRLDRRGIAQQINVINKYNPRVIGLDTFFSSLKEDSIGDLMLAEALANANNVVLGTHFINPGDEDDPFFYGMRRSHPLFRQHGVEASVGLISESAGTQQEEFKVVRDFFPKQSYMDSISGEVIENVAFGVKLAEFLNPEAAERFLERNNEEEVINYRGNIFTLQNIDKRPMFFAVDWMDVLEENFDPGIIEDRIVIFGMAGENFNEPYWVEDKFFTPMNTKYAGRADEDMFGVVIHANIAAMVLNEDYIDTMKNTTSILIAVALCFFNVGLFTLVYRKLPLWYDGLTKLIQLIEVILLMFLLVMVFHWYSFQMELTLGIIVILLAGDSLEVLFGVGYNLFSRKKRKELFTIRE